MKIDVRNSLSGNCAIICAEVEATNTEMVAKGRRINHAHHHVALFSLR
nr:hypothetical protein [Ferrovum sp.]